MPTDVVDPPASSTDWGDGLKAAQEEGGRREDGQHAAKDGVVGDLRQPRAIDGRVADVVDGPEVLCAAPHQAGNGTEDPRPHQDEAEDLLDHGGGLHPPHVQGKEQEGTDHADEDGGQVNAGARHGVEGFPFQDAGDEIAEHVGHLDGLPGNHPDEAAHSGPAGNKGDFLVEGLVGKGHAAPGHRVHGHQLAVTQGDGDHQDQGDEIAQRRGHRPAAVGHPAIDRDRPAHADDGAEPQAEKVDSADAFLGFGVLHMDTSLSGFSHFGLQSRFFSQKELFGQSVPKGFSAVKQRCPMPPSRNLMHSPKNHDGSREDRLPSRV